MQFLTNGAFALLLLHMPSPGYCIPIDWGQMLEDLFGGGGSPTSDANPPPPTASTPPAQDSTPSQPGPQPQSSTLIPSTCFDSQSNLESYFSYDYPWGDTHNGAARMSAPYALASAGTLTLTSVNTGASDFKYNSGTVFATQTFNVTRAGGLDFSASFRAATTKGTWPAFWLNAATGWPPEIDIAEWKGDGNIFFNTFNTSSQIAAHPVPYPDPDDWHEFKCSLRDSGNGVDMSITFYLDGALVTTQVGGNYIGQDFHLIIDLQMEGGSGSPGPTTSKLFLSPRSAVS